MTNTWPVEGVAGDEYTKNERRRKKTRGRILVTEHNYVVYACMSCISLPDDLCLFCQFCRRMADSGARDKLAAQRESMIPS